MDDVLKKKIVFVVGPTSSGKTDLAIEAIQDFGYDYEKSEWNAEIVGADSRQIFKDFDLTSGKATLEELSVYPKSLTKNTFFKKLISNIFFTRNENVQITTVVHHLINTIDPGTYFSVVDYKKLALGIIDDIWKRGKVPVVCGGTGQYIDAIFYDEVLSDVGPDEDFRKACESKSNEELYNEIVEKDERTARVIDKNNKVRLVRALEIIRKLGKVPEVEKRERFPKDKYDVKIINTSRKYDRDTLRGRVETRFRRRLAEGMVEEVRKAKEKYDLSGEYLEKLGLEFRYMSQYLDGKISYELMVERLVYETRKYAKRQETWFRKYTNTENDF